MDSAKVIRLARDAGFTDYTNTDTSFICVAADIHKFAALTEYGEHVKAEAVKVCQNTTNMDIKHGIRLIDKDDCAAAIKDMELP